MLASQIVAACVALNNLCIDRRIEEQVEYMRGDCGRLDERVPDLQTGGALWADQSITQGRRSDLDVCPRRAEMTARLERVGLKRPAHSNYRS